MKSIEITTSILNGKIKRNKNIIIDAFKAFEGKELTLILKPFKKLRSNSQNRYYWGLVIPIWQKILKDEWGDFYSKEETHEFLKYNCNYIEKVNQETGEILRLSKSTKENTTSDQEDFHLQCRNLALEMFNIEIPLPNEQIEIEL